MTVKEIETNLEEGESLKQIAQAYSEIANLKIKKIRQETERNRIFFKDIYQTYALIKSLAGKKKINIVKAKKRVSIVLTSNYRFYGKINSDLLEFFTRSTQNLDTDKIVLGKAAIDYFRALKKKKVNYQEVYLKDDQPNEQELAMLVNVLKNYNQVLVFHSTLKSLLVQQPTVTDITTSSEQSPLMQKQANIRFIFEPELAKILAFFDSSVITLLLESTFLESELSRTASRFISMDSAETQANKFIKEYQKLKAYAKRNLANIAILESFASQIAVRKENYA